MTRTARREAVAAGVLALAALTGAALPAVAQEPPPPRKAFRVCQDPNNLPFSSLDGQGYENKIAELFAKELGLPVEYYSFPQRLAFVRNTLRYKLPGEDFRCDIIMGVPAGYDQVSATKPYYRSTYALVYAPGKGLDGVKSIDDFLALDRAQLQKLRIGLYDRSPASEWLNKHQLVEQTRSSIRARSSRRTSRAARSMPPSYGGRSAATSRRRFSSRSWWSCRCARSRASNSTFRWRWACAMANASGSSRSRH